MERLSSYEADRLNDALYGMDKDGGAQTQVSARFVKTDQDGTTWVRFEGADKDTPLTSAMSVRAREGDIIDVSLGGYEAVGGGNRTDPSAGFQDVRAVTVEVEHVKGKQAEFEKVTAQELEADKARIGQLEADSAEIEELVAQKATIAELEAAEGRISDLESDHVSTTDLQAVNGEITNLKAKDVTIEGNLSAATGRIGTIEADYLKAADMTAEQARVNNLLAGKATVNDLNAATGRITVLESTKANISDIEANYITADDIEATYMHADMTNSDVAWIQNGVIANGAISSAMINDVSANKLTAGTINGSVINVTNLNADNITAGTINGQRIGAGSLSLDKLSENVYTEAEVDAKLSDMQAEIDGAIETWTGTEVPTLNNAPASSWTTATDRDKHVGDVYFNTTSGYNYRFTKSGTGSSATYSWLQIKDTDITNALQRIQTAEGKITTFDSDISTLKTDTGELKTKTQSLETSLGDKVDTTTFNELEDTVDGHSQTISQHTTAISQKADTSTVNQVTNRVTKAEQDISGINTTIGQLQTTVEGKADGSTVTTISNKLNTVETTVNGHTETLSSVQSTLSSKADNSTVATLRSEYNETKTTVSGHETRLTATESVANGVRTDLDNLEIGGRNLLGNTAYLVDGEEYTGKATSAWAGLLPTNYVPLLEETTALDEKYTLSFDARVSGAPIRVQWRFNYISTSGTYKQFSGTLATPVDSTDWHRYYITLTTPSTRPDDYARSAIIVQSQSGSTTDYVEVRRFKLERGNKATDWTPAPEDLETEVTTLKTDYATYKQTTTEALSEIGTTYVTKTELGTETSNRQTAIQQLNNTISSKANASDVYTKQQTDGLISTEVSNRNSAIQQSAENITATVSSTYATKSEARQTASDSGKREIVTEDAAELPLLSLTAYGECEQDGTPTPNAPVPIKAVRGRNLLNPNSFSQTVLGVEITVNNDGSITFAGTATANISSEINTLIPDVELGEGTYTTSLGNPSLPSGITLRGLYTGGASANIPTTGATNQIFTLNGGSYHFYIIILSGTVLNHTIYPQLEAGTTAHPYAPYGCINLQSVGKNLLDCSNGLEYYGGILRSAGSYYTASNGTITATNQPKSGPLPGWAVRAGGSYILSGYIDQSLVQFYIQSLDANGAKIGSQKSTSVYADSEHYFSVQLDSFIDDGASSFLIGVGSTTVTSYVLKPQLERGTEATEYEPYRESVSYIDLQGHELASLLDGTRDVLRVDSAGRVWIEQNVRRITLDALSGITLGWPSAAPNAFYGHNYSYMHGVAGYGARACYCDEMSNAYTPAQIASNAPGNNYAIAIGNNSYFYLNLPGVTTVVGAAEWITANKPNMYIPLATPATIELGTIAPPTTFDGGTVHVDAEIQPLIDASWWTKAGYDAGKAVSATEAELKVQSDAISLKVSKNDVINQINVSTEGATIDADRVNITGAAIFTSGRLSQSSLDGAYDAKGAASAAQTAATNAANQATDTKLQSYSTTSQMNTAIGNAVDAIEVGGRNLLKGTADITGDVGGGGVTEWGTDSMFGGVKTAKTQSSWSGIYMRLANIADAMVAGEKYTASVYVKTDEDRDVPFTAHRFTHKTNVGDGSLGTHSLKAGVWEQLSITFTATEGDDSSKTTTSARIESSQAVPLWWAAPKLERGNKPTDWAPAPEDIAANAVNRTQRIYYRSNAPITSWSMPTSWVTNNQNTWNSGVSASGWSTKVTPIASSTGESAAKYLYLYTCEQRQMADGTIYHTPVTLDESTTVIDGGKIITHSVTAEQLNATSINASKSLTIGAMADATQASILNSNMQIGGRNLFQRNSMVVGYLGSTGVIQVNEANGERTSEFIAIAPGTSYALQYWTDSSLTSWLCLQWYDSAKSFLSEAYRNHMTTDYYSGAFTSPGNAAYARISARWLADGTARVKFERGNKLTDWSPAPEDVDSSILSAQNAATQAANAATDGKLESYSTTAQMNAAIDVAASEITSRGEQLVTNGNGFMGDNTNWSAFTFDGAKSNGSAGSFTIGDGTVQKTVALDEMFPIDSTGIYTCGFDVLTSGGEVPARIYAYLKCFDVDKNEIAYENVWFRDGSTTTLTQELKAGDTVVHLADVSGFVPSTNLNGRSLIFWDYTNSFGYTYPPETYSKNVIMAAYEESGVDQTANTITLKQAYSGKTHAAGTSVSRTAYGSTYTYYWYRANGQEIGYNEWEHAEGTYRGFGKNDWWIRHGAAYCQPGFLINYSANTSWGSGVGVAQRKVWITNLSVMKKRVTDAELSAVSTVANAAAPKTQAVKRTQRIYFRKSASGAPSTPGSWVTNGNTDAAWTKYNAWSTRVPPISESAAEGATKYLYLYTCEQREMGDGTLAYTTVLLDDSTTIIDGGNIITGSVAANKLEVYDATIQKIRADAIDTASITIGQEQVDDLDETLKEQIPKSMSQLENDSGYVTDGYVPAAIPAAIVKGELQADQINVDSLRTALLQAANLLIGNIDEAHIVANGNRMSFMAGGHEVAYVQVDDEGGTFYMTRSIVVKDMQFGDGKWKWYKRDNNNMSLKWMGGM